MRPVKALAAALLLCVVSLSACGDSGESSSTPAASEGSSSEQDQPKSGGSITFGVFGETNGLDPTVSFATGVIGGAELAAIYDTVMRYDVETGEYAPNTAESLEPNADYSVWTLKLRPGIKFTDGTDYDAAAVKFNLERHVAPGSKSNYVSQVSNTIKSMDVVDPLTLRFTMTSPIASFPYILSVGPGMIASPTAINQYGKDYGTAAAVGAGPFMLDSYRPKEALVLKRNPDYFNGPAHLDSVEFVALGAASTTYESFKSGALDVAFLREPGVNETAKSEQKPNYLENEVSSPLVLAINNGVQVTCSSGEPAGLCAGKADGTKVPADTPGQDIRVRRAIAAAIDPEVVNERAYSGKAIASNDLFAPGFKWNPKVPANPYDPEKAKSLVAEAKAAGWDGKIRLTVPSTQKDFGLAIQTQLQAVGFEVTFNDALDVTAATLKVAVQHDYDLGNSGYSFGSSDTAYFRLARQLHSESPGNILGYASPDMDAALDAVRIAATDEAKAAAYKKVAEVFVRDVPALPIDHYSEVIIWDERVHGLDQGPDTIVLLDRAWVS